MTGSDSQQDEVQQEQTNNRSIRYSDNRCQSESSNSPTGGTQRGPRLSTTSWSKTSPRKKSKSGTSSGRSEKQRKRSKNGSKRRTQDRSSTAGRPATRKLSTSQSGKLLTDGGREEDESRQFVHLWARYTVVVLAAFVLIPTVAVLMTVLIMGPTMVGLYVKLGIFPWDYFYQLFAGTPPEVTLPLVYKVANVAWVATLVAALIAAANLDPEVES